MNNWHLSSGLQRLFEFLLCLCLLAVSGPVFANLDFGPLKGDLLLGKPLMLTTSLSGLSDEQLTQLKPGCMDAKVIPTGQSDLVKVSKTQPLILDFQHTLSTGGSLQMRSLQAVNEPVMRVLLISYCPMVLFEKKWTILINPPVRPDRSTEIVESNQSSRQVMQFQLANSVMLKASQVQPRLPRPLPASRETPPESQPSDEPDPALKFDTFDSSHETDRQEPVAQQSQNSPSSEGNPHPLDNHLIESSTRSPQTASPQRVEPQVVEPGTHSFSDDMPYGWFVLAGSSVLLMLAGGVLWIKRKSRGSVLSNVEPQFLMDKDEISSVAQDLAFDDETENEDDLTKQSSSQLFQSFIGVPADNQAVEFDFTDQRPRYDGMIDSNDPSELAIAQVNRDEPRSWKLPEGYASLVAHRNSTIENRQQSDSVVLRASLGLVEYCFQSALQMREIHDTGIKRIMQELKVQDEANTLHTEEAVPDMLNSFVNEKMCRIDSPEQRELMIAQLAKLSAYCADYPLCFNTSAWAEFLFQAGREAMIN